MKTEPKPKKAVKTCPVCAAEPKHHYIILRRNGSCWLCERREQWIRQHTDER